MEDTTLWLTFLGDSKVGKSCIIRRFVDKRFIQDISPTIGVEFAYKTVTIDDKQYKLQLWDTSGQERFMSLATTYYRRAHGIFLCFALDNPSSFQHLQHWLLEVERYAPPTVPIIFLGNKADLLPIAIPSSSSDGHHADAAGDAGAAYSPHLASSAPLAYSAPSLATSASLVASSVATADSSHYLSSNQQRQPSSASAAAPPLILTKEVVERILAEKFSSSSMASNSNHSNMSSSSSLNSQQTSASCPPTMAGQLQLPMPGTVPMAANSSSSRPGYIGKHAYRYYEVSALRSDYAAVIDEALLTMALLAISNNQRSLSSPAANRTVSLGHLAAGVAASMGGAVAGIPYVSLPNNRSIDHQSEDRSSLNNNNNNTNKTSCLGRLATWLCCVSCCCNKSKPATAGTAGDDGQGEDSSRKQPHPSSGKQQQQSVDEVASADGDRDGNNISASYINKEDFSLYSQSQSHSQGQHSSNPSSQQSSQLNSRLPSTSLDPPPPQPQQQQALLNPLLQGSISSRQASSEPITVGSSNIAAKSGLQEGLLSQDHLLASSRQNKWCNNSSDETILNTVYTIECD